MKYLITGVTSFIKNLFLSKNLNIIKCDLLNLAKFKKIFKEHDIIFHMTANSKVRFCLKYPKKKLEQNANPYQNKII